MPEDRLLTRKDRTAASEAIDDGSKEGVRCCVLTFSSFCIFGFSVVVVVVVRKILQELINLIRSLQSKLPDYN